ncbi:unnamed protein product [Darwinula stevensoni]|uniref:Peroxisomal multifunctional enzyme type 2 n=1 Tax=Darwinula stevensoni TaxID=69355 RepID=A0A7R9A9D8_9CRUS|nr:unnamed protein product [Darwinula stevensoni]CAG0897269.1 unnamed protein product [Darwinula stevensoni]
MDLSFSGRVVIITGAGNGLGREYALLFAKHGAKVVVNDLGVSTSGDGKDRKAADAVVEEIGKAGGVAVSNYDSVEEGDKIVRTAMENFGRVDIVVNNAGFLRDKSFAKMTTKEWDDIHKIHLRSSFIVTKAAWPHMQRQRYGRIIMTSSTAGIYGNFGQANYSAAKLGVIGLSNTLAIEGQRYGIHSNVIVPMAASRLTQGILPPELYDRLKPSCVAPVVLWLCHEDCPDSGGVFEAAGGLVAKYRWQRSKGLLIDPIEPQRVREEWNRITDMDGGLSPDSNADLLASVYLEQLQNPPEKPKTNPTSGGSLLNRDLLLRYESCGTYEFSSQEAILYSLSVGCSLSDTHGLRYLYEGHEIFSPLPTFSVIPAQTCLFGGELFSGSLPGIDFDLSKLLHGEQYIEACGDRLPASGTLTSRCTVADVLDKGSGALIYFNVETNDESGNRVAFNQFGVFIVGQGGFGGPRKTEKAIPIRDPPSREPDKTFSFKTGVNQAALYRLNGDFNPLHIDPDFAALGGFEQPILHGLCSLGIVARQLLQYCAGDDPTRFHSIKVRFAKPVVPGETLETKAWIQDNGIHFATHVKENGNPVITGGYMELKGGKKGTAGGEDSNLKKMLETLQERLKSRSSQAKALNAAFLWIVSQNDGNQDSWTLDLRSKDAPHVHAGGPRDGRDPDVTLSIQVGDLASLVEGSLPPSKAFFQGKLKVKGNMMLTQKLESLLAPQAKL